MMIMKSQKKDMFFFENAVPVDLTEVTGMYDLYKKSDDLIWLYRDPDYANPIKYLMFRSPRH